jgi:3-methyladenine DNA glycosylase AlkD
LKKKERRILQTVEVVLFELKKCARPDQLTGMAKYGMTIENRLGVSVPEVRRIAKEIGKNHTLALELWKTKIAEARMVASMIADPNELASDEMDSWVKDFNSWDVCDQVCMNLFDKTPLAWNKVIQWSEREEEFVKRAAYALIACLAWHDKSAEDEKFIKLLPLISNAIYDNRNYVKKAASWALRHIGKRNERLHPVILKEAEQLKNNKNKTARWIGSDTVRDLTSDSILRRMEKLSSN